MIYRTTEITDFVNVKRLFIVRRNCLWIFLVFLKFWVLEFFQEFVLNHDSKTFIVELGYTWRFVDDYYIREWHYSRTEFLYEKRTQQVFACLTSMMETLDQSRNSVQG